MLDNESGLESLLQNFTKLSGRDRKRIKRHLSDHDTSLMEKYLKEPNREIQGNVTDEHKDDISFEEKTQHFNLSHYSPWLADCVERILNDDGMMVSTSATECAKFAVLKSVKDDQSYFASTEMKTDNKRSFMSSLRRREKATQ